MKSKLSNSYHQTVIKKKDSVDCKFHQCIKEINNSHLEHSKILERLETMKARLKEFDSVDFVTLTDLELNEIASLKLEIPKLEKVCCHFKGDAGELSRFFLDLGMTLSDYYQALENKSNNNYSFTELSKGVVGKIDNQVEAIIQTFNHRLDPLNHYEEIELSTTTNGGGGDNHHPMIICQKCFVSKEYNLDEGILICPTCLDSENIIIHTDKPCYNDSPCDNIYFSYLRINHFREKLSKVQQKSNFKIPRAIEEKLCEMFHRIQDPFIKHCPADKTNFTSYNYVINKCLHIINHPEYASHFPLLKSKDNLYKADMIWKKICIDLDLPFISSN